MHHIITIIHTFFSALIACKDDRMQNSHNNFLETFVASIGSRTELSKI